MLLKQKIRQACPHSDYILQSDCNPFVCVNLILTITKTKIVTASHGSITVLEVKRKRLWRVNLQVFKIIKGK